MTFNKLAIGIVLCLSVFAVFVTCEEWVLTPHGYRPQSCVHSALETDIIINEEKSLKIMRKGENGEYYVHKDLPPCPIPFSFHQNTTKPTIPEAAKAAGFPNGWAAYTSYVTQAMDYFYGQWPVPQNPADKQDQTVFLFTGFQNAYGGVGSGPVTIIQPVIQFGPSAAGGGNYWAMASWFVGGFHSVYSELKNTTPGHLIKGTMQQGDGTSWTIITADATSGVNTQITVSTDVSEIAAFVTLEVYSIRTCGDYPNGDVPFTNLGIDADKKAITPRWETHAEPGCQESVRVVNPTAVTVKF